MESLAHGKLMGQGEKLIALADTYVDEDLVIEEFVSDGKGGYFFYDCPTSQWEPRLEGVSIDDYILDSPRYATEHYSTPLEAREAWNRRTGQQLSQLDLFRGLT